MSGGQAGPEGPLRQQVRRGLISLVALSAVIKPMRVIGRSLLFPPSVSPPPLFPGSLQPVPAFPKTRFNTKRNQKRRRFNYLYINEAGQILCLNKDLAEKMKSRRPHKQPIMPPVVSPPPPLPASPPPPVKRSR